MAFSELGQLLGGELDETEPEPVRLAQGCAQVLRHMRVASAVRMLSKALAQRLLDRLAAVPRFERRMLSIWRNPDPVDAYGRRLGT